MKTKSTGFLVAVVLAGFMLVPFSYGFAAGQEEQARPARPGSEIRSGLALDLTPEQEKKLEEFRQARIKENDAFRDEMIKIRRERRDLAPKLAENQGKINDLIDKMSRLRAERQKAALKNRLELEKIFTPEQLDKMRNFRRLAPGRVLSQRAPMGFSPRMNRSGRPFMFRSPNLKFRDPDFKRGFRVFPWWRW